MFDNIFFFPPEKLEMREVVCMVVHRFWFETRARQIPPLPDALGRARNTFKEPAGGMWGILKARGH